MFDWQHFRRHIFKNCFQVGILPISLSKEQIGCLAEEYALPKHLIANLDKQTITTAGGTIISFEIEPLRRSALMEGLDDIGVILKYRDKSRVFFKKDRKNRPWLS